MTRKTNENYLAYAERATQSLCDGSIGYDEWCEAVLGETIYSEENLRRCYQFFKKFLDKLDEEEIKVLNDDDRVREIKQAKEDLMRERKKIQTVNLEYHANMRNEARGELFNEFILEAIDRLEPLKKPEVVLPVPKQGKSVGVLCIADAHYGVEIELKSIFNETVNVYNPTVFKGRMYKLMEQIMNDYDNLGYDELIVFDLGDAVENILRTTSLTKLHTGVIDSALQYAEFMANWMNELQDKLGVPMKYLACGGNHDMLRLLDSRKQFEEENMMKVVVEFIRLRLKDNTNIEIAPYGDSQFETICGMNVLAIHGDGAKDKIGDVAFWEQYHNISIDILLMGHVHHSEQITTGYGNIGEQEVIKVPSLVGADTYSKSVRKIARAGAKFMLFEDEVGKTWEKTIILN